MGLPIIKGGTIYLELSSEIYTAILNSEDYSFGTTFDDALSDGFYSEEYLKELKNLLDSIKQRKIVKPVILTINMDFGDGNYTSIAFSGTTQFDYSGDMDYSISIEFVFSNKIWRISISHEDDYYIFGRCQEIQYIE